MAEHERCSSNVERFACGLKNKAQPDGSLIDISESNSVFVKNRSKKLSKALDEVLVSVDRRATSTELGVALRLTDREQLVIVEIRAKGLIALWNSTHKDEHERIGPGDVIVAVNGRADKLVRRLGQPKRFLICIRKSPAFAKSTSSMDRNTPMEEHPNSTVTEENARLLELDRLQPRIDKLVKELSAPRKRVAGAVDTVVPGEFNSSVRSAGPRVSSTKVFSECKALDSGPQCKSTVTIRSAKKAWAFNWLPDSIRPRPAATTIRP